jgi:DNA helicase IV
MAKTAQNLNYKKEEIDIANNSLSKMGDISNEASMQLASRQNNNALGVQNTFNNIAAVNNNIRRNQETILRLRSTRDKPFIGKIKVSAVGNNPIEFYITETGEAFGGLSLISIRSPMGALFSTDVGNKKDVCNKVYTVLQKDVYVRVGKDNNGCWDARAEFYFSNFADSVESLRGLLGTTFSGILPIQGAANSNGKLKRIVIDHIGFKENPMLDEIQDEVFRMDPNQAVLLMGPPGTGKTTTLIKKLGLNLDSKYSKLKKDKSWYMFTPTELLKEYLKEAFNSQGISAPDQNLWVWGEFSSMVARNIFPILKTTTRSGLILLRDGECYMKSIASSDQIKLFDKFYNWQEKYFLTKLCEKFVKIQQSEDEDIVKIFKDISETDFCKLEVLSKKILPIQNDIENKRKLIKKELDEFIAKVALKSIFNNNPPNKDTLSEYLGELQKYVQDELGDTNEEFNDNDEEDEDEVVNLSSKEIQDILKNYVFDSLKQLSVAFVKKRTASKKCTIVGRYIDFETKVSDEDKLKIAGYITQKGGLTSFSNIKKSYKHGLVRRYQAFRKECTEFFVDNFDNGKISSSELDVLLLSYLKIAKSLGEADELQKKELLKSQIFVDEITDFSPIQISVMKNLLRSDAKSFFGAGDFNQRLTHIGISNEYEMEWAIPKISIKKISVAYRQSNQLREFLQYLINKEVTVEQPKYLDMDGVKPVLERNLDTDDKRAKWLGERIKEIDASLDGKLPSIAILVNTEDEILPLATALNNFLQNVNIQVLACVRGKIGTNCSVRIFSIEYIKGLEFEAVFFVGIDELARKNEDLFDKYLYVGASRAATFLGITLTSNELPKKIKGAEHLFGSRW